MGQAIAATTRDGRFSYLAAGPDGAQPVVFLHGIGGGARLWSSQLESFAPRYRAIALDLPGYGGSQPLAETGIRTYAEAVADFLRTLRLASPVLVGHSIGGMIVQTYMADRLGPIRAAVLAQTTPAFGGKDPRWAEEFVAARLGPLDRGETMPSLAPAIAASLLGEDPDPAAFALARDCVAAVPEATWRASVMALVGFDKREALGRISVPTLLIAGSKDQNAPAPTMAKMAERIPGAEYVCLDGIGHLAFAEAPEAFDGAVLDFLNRRLATGEAAS
ncbi:alpha/beta fold hydrolase [Enterovirga aerilata]|uniref:Alpha/beta fold hydrolase n=1 Tax=Enterovirga aerilata TaxID=2730920 RepID=A0A849I7Y7_9HYPH|nr:alpha/beta fold hydrolase [Enterovirga sp. DB1703]NNM73431.1 alpha/beta fold hydrolase [Enterovirga sp. DB1703]